MKSPNDITKSEHARFTHVYRKAVRFPYKTRKPVNTTLKTAKWK
jgi:hypothetical protein